MKKILSNLFLIAITSSIFAMQYWGDGVFADFGYSSGVGINTPIEGGLGVRHSIPNASFLGAISLNGFSSDITTSALYTPLTTKNGFSLGVEYSLHAGIAYVPGAPKYSELDNNLYLSAIYQNKNPKVPLKTSIALGLNAKTTIQKLSQTTITTFDILPTVEFKMQLRFLEDHELLLRLATYDIMRYKLWLNTWWQIGYSYDINDTFSIATLFHLAYADQLTLSGTLDGFQAKLAFVYKGHL